MEKNRRWTAFLKLEGETAVNRDEEIAEEFDMFVQTIRGILVNYEIAVFVGPEKQTIAKTASTSDVLGQGGSNW